MVASARSTFAVNPELLKLARGDPDGEAGRAIRGALVEVGLIWHKDHLPRHFQPNAPQLYPGAYTPRSKGYSLRKAKPHRVDGVLYPGTSGPMRYTRRMEKTLLENAPNVSSKLNSRSISVTLRTAHARALNLWKGGSRKHNFQRELTALNDQDMRWLSYWFQKELSARLPVALEWGASRWATKAYEASVA